MNDKIKAAARRIEVKRLRLYRLTKQDKFIASL
jgi:hypothetical protein